jgi:hypothetical protein
MAPKQNTASSGDERRHWLLSLIIAAFYSQDTNTIRGNPRFLLGSGERITANDSQP